MDSLNQENKIDNLDDKTHLNSKTLKTDLCTLNAVKRYRLKNADKIKEYREQYNRKKKEDKLKENPYLEYTRQQLFNKIFELDKEKIELNNRINQLEELVKQNKIT